MEKIVLGTGDNLYRLEGWLRAVYSFRPSLWSYEKFVVGGPSNVYKERFDRTKLCFKDVPSVFKCKGWDEERVRLEEEFQEWLEKKRLPSPR